MDIIDRRATPTSQIDIMERRRLRQCSVDPKGHFIGILLNTETEDYKKTASILPWCKGMSVVMENRGTPEGRKKWYFIKAQDYSIIFYYKTKKETKI